MGLLTLLIGSLIGAGLMYFLDPNTGKRRRSLTRDKLVKLGHTTSDQADILAENTANRVQGAAAETMKRFTSDGISDDTLVARVRSEMGRYVSHPHAIEVAADGGIVTLTGNILSQEVQPFVSKVKSISGVRRVENQLKAHEEAGNIPDLQGGKTRADLR